LENQTGQESVEEIRGLLENINQAWLHNRTDELEKFLHRDIVIAQPGLKAQARGRQACINSYKEFVSHSVIRRFETSGYVIDVWGRTAVASYRFVMEYEIQGAPHHDGGTDLFVLVREGGKWLVVWRTIIPLPAEKAGQADD
jgi:hypothetical protein